MRSPSACWCCSTATTPGFQLVDDVQWIKDPDIAWKLGVDGISLWLVVLTGILFPIAMLGAPAHDDEKSFYAWLLVLEAGCLGAFLALDLFLFFVFFEIVLVPMYFLISGWGYGERKYAATKFFLYTMFGSAFMLVGTVALSYLHAKGGPVTFDLQTLAERAGRAGRRPPAAGSSCRSPSPSPSRCRCSRCTPGCPTPTPRRPPPAR